MSDQEAEFLGREWTDKKLGVLTRYLNAYTDVMKNMDFELLYIDSFAGTGYRIQAEDSGAGALFFPELAEEEPQGFLDGSPRIALKVTPAFDRYVFIELDEARYQKLSALKQDFQHLSENIEIVHSECNRHLRALCKNTDWKGKRGVLFMDPFGMQVEWPTLEAVAATQALDVWILFPLGQAVMRLLRRDAAIGSECARRLDLVFGTHDWYYAFYSAQEQRNLFGEVESSMHRTATWDSISRFWIDRLRTIFADVAPNPKVLRNSKRNPLYLLCFAVANPSIKARGIAMRIARHILDMED